MNIQIWYAKILLLAHEMGKTFVLFVLLFMIGCSSKDESLCLKVGSPSSDFLVNNKYLEFYDKNSKLFWINFHYPSGSPVTSAQDHNKISVLVEGLDIGQASQAEYRYHNRSTIKQTAGELYEFSADGNVIFFEGAFLPGGRQSAKRRFSQNIEITYIFPSELFAERSKLDKVVIELLSSMKINCER